jgi:biopolymer transport protein ExbB
MSDNPYGILALWAQGDAVTKGVAITLFSMSVVSWYVIVTRAWRAALMRRDLAPLAGFWHTHSFSEGMALLKDDHGHNPFRHLALEGEAAVVHHASSRNDLHGQISLAEWLTESLRGAIDESAERMQSGLAVLASVGSTAPFVGLFGTVWGIYHALIGIGTSGQASIDKVAGPVGEALIMTAFGLAVAIPAVLSYNVFMRANKGVINRLHRFARQLHAYFLTGAPITQNEAKEEARVMPMVKPGRKGA